MAERVAERVMRCEHAEIRVGDLSVALDFYCNVMGFTELGREADRVYLGCGDDGRFDLAVVERGAGIEHLALRAEDQDHLDQLAARLGEHGVPTARLTGAEPGVVEALSFALPSGHRMELVVVAEDAGSKTGDVAGATAARPLDLDHVNLKLDDVRGTAEFLRDVVGLRISDVGMRGEEWIRAWCRVANHHHDVGLDRRRDDDETLSHVAFAMRDIEQVKAALDVLAAAGYRIELGIGRHRIGNGLYAYFREPGGNRFEFTLEATIVEPTAETGYYGDLDDTFDAWVAAAHERLPASFARGS